MFFTKPLNEITWSDIVEFSERQIPEGTTLDYKQEFPKNLEKTIAAFANTNGGTIIIGIKKTDDNRPILPIEGIVYKRGLSERVTSIILSNITPPIKPEIGIIQNDDNTKAIVIINVPESEDTPHAIDSNTKVYVRTSDINQSEDLIDIQKLSWLFNKREKSIKIREQLIESAENRYQDRIGLKNPQYSNFSTLSFAIVPEYPKDEMFLSPPELKKIKPKIEVSEYYGTSDFFPIPDHEPSTLLRDGISLELIIEDLIYYTEINSKGLYYYKQSLEKKINWLDEEKKIIRVSEIFIRLDEFIDSAEKLYKILKYDGKLYFEANYENLGNINLGLFPYQRLNKPTGSNVNNKLRISLPLPEEKKIQFIYNASKHLCWNYDWEVNLDNIIQCFKRYKR